MRTEKKLIFDFINAAGLILEEHFTDKELRRIQESGASLFLFVETAGRVFKGVRCVLKKLDGDQEEVFALTEKVTPQGKIIVPSAFTHGL